jgi:uncharacterized protein YukE
MANIWGMDIAQVRELASLLGQKAQEIDTLISTISSKLSSTEWKGPDSEKFRNDWSGTLTTSLKNVAQSLRDTQQRASANAQDQETASQ